MAMANREVMRFTPSCEMFDCRLLLGRT